MHCLIIICLFSVLLLQLSYFVDGCEVITTLSYFTHFTIHATCFSLIWPSSGLFYVVSCSTEFTPCRGRQSLKLKLIESYKVNKLVNICLKLLWIIIQVFLFWGWTLYALVICGHQCSFCLVPFVLVFLIVDGTLLIHRFWCSYVASLCQCGVSEWNFHSPATAAKLHCHIPED
jgi:hypothetical protein